MISEDEKIAIRRKVKDAFKQKMPLILCDLLDSSNGEKKMVKRSPVHTLGKSVASGNKSTKKKPSIGQQIAIDRKYNRLTSRKYFTSSLAVQISAYEKERMENGQKVGGWTKSASHQVKEAIKSKAPRVIHEVTFRDKSTELFVSKTRKYGHMKINGEVVINPHQKRWIRMFHCGSKMEKLTNPDGEVFYESKTHDCGDRLCMRCNKRKSYKDFIAYKDVIMAEIENPVMLTLHGRSPLEGGLESYMEHLTGSFSKLRKQNSKDAKKGLCEKWSLYWALEITINSTKGSFHPHYHCIVSESQAEDILAKWIADDPDNREEEAFEGAIGKVIKSEDELIENFKYAVKIAEDFIDENGEVVKKKPTQKQIDDNVLYEELPNKQSMAPIPMIYEMLMAFYRRRRNGAMGKIYNNKLTTEESKELIMQEVKEKIRKEGFDVSDNPILELADDWEYDYKRSNYFANHEGIEFKLSNFRPSKGAKEFLRVKDKPIETEMDLKLDRRRDRHLWTEDKPLS